MRSFTLSSKLPSKSIGLKTRISSFMLSFYHSCFHLNLFTIGWDFPFLRSFFLCVLLQLVEEPPLADDIWLHTGLHIRHHPQRGRLFHGMILCWEWSVYMVVLKIMQRPFWNNRSTTSASLCADFQLVDKSPLADYMKNARAQLACYRWIP